MNHQTQELHDGDRVFDPLTGARGVVVEVKRYPTTIQPSYWIKVRWENRHEIDECLECHVRKLRS